MKGLAVFALLAVAGVAIWKHRLSLSVTGSTSLSGKGQPQIEAGGYPSGVSIYDGDQAASQSLQQLYATQSSNPDSVTPIGFSPAFGPEENQPARGEMTI